VVAVKFTSPREKSPSDGGEGAQVPNRAPVSFSLPEPPASTYPDPKLPPFAVRKYRMYPQMDICLRGHRCDTVKYTYPSLTC